MVNYQRGRRRQRDTTGPSRAQFHGRERQPYVKRSYASVTRADGSRGNYPSRYDREPGYRPQFFDRRLRSGAGNNNNKTTRIKQKQMYQRHYVQRQKEGAQTHTDKRTHRSEDPDFVNKVRGIHTVIKLAHHLKNVSASEPPPTIVRLTDNLSTIIKPAAPNPKTQLLIEGNAKNWAHTTLLILQDHYTDTMEAEVEKLEGLSAHDWHAPFEVAKSWARRNLGRRLKEDTFDQVEALLVARLDHRTPDDNTCEAVDQSDSPTHSPQTRPQVVPRSIQCMAQVHATAHTHSQTLPTTSVEVHRRPKTTPTPQGVTTKCMATMTEQRGDWSPVQPEVEEEDTIPPTPLSAVEETPQTTLPKDQRPRRLPISRETSRHPTTNPCVINASDPILDLTSEELELVLGGPGVDMSPSERLIQLDHDSTSDGTVKLKTAVQSHLDLGGDSQPFLASTPLSPTKSTRRPTRHLNTARKMQDWSLSVGKKWLILGDSNVARFPPFNVPDLQVDSYPGATFRHAEAILTKATCSTTVERIILSFGLNHRSQNLQKTTTKQLQAAIRASKLRFPQAEIWIPLINFSRSLPLKERTNLLDLNAYIRSHYKFIPELPVKLFETEEDKLHWTRPTAKLMLGHWCQHAN